MSVASSISLFPSMAILLAFIIKFVSNIIRSSSPFHHQSERRKVFLATAISFNKVHGANKPENVRGSPPLPWMTTVFLSAVSLFIDALLRSDGTVRRFLSPLEFMVGPDKRLRRGVRTADVEVDSSRGVWFRLFLPASQCHGHGKLPVFIYFHGGGFAFLSPASTVYDAFCRKICEEVGAAVVSVNYRLSPEHRCPAPYDDGIDVLRFLDFHSRNSVGFMHGASSADLLRLFFETADLSSCFIAGDSAGGNIAHHVARRWTDGKAIRGGQLNLGGPIAIQPFFGGEGRVASETRLTGAPLVNTERTDWLWRAFLPEGADRNHTMASTLAAVADVGEEFPPVMVVVGGYDPLQDSQRIYVDGLRERKKQVRLVEYAEAIHAFYLVPGPGASATGLIVDLKKFVQKHFLAAAPPSREVNGHLS